VPPEYLGAHVAAPFSHQTGRFMPLSLRCATALFGHFGVEWVDTPDDTAWVHGVVAADGSAALMSYVQLEPPPHGRPVSLRLPGLDPGRRYLATNVTPGEPSARWSRGGEVLQAAEVTGAVLAGVGIDLPAVRPLTTVVVFAEAV